MYMRIYALYRNIITEKETIAKWVYHVYRCITRKIKSLIMNTIEKSPRSEIQIQAKCFQFLWNYYPLTRRCFFHVPNGGSRNKIEGMQLKASGVVPGIPDMILMWKGRAYGFEFKTTTGILSTAQKEVHEAWTGQNITVHIIRSFEQFEGIIKSILS